LTCVNSMNVSELLHSFRFFIIHLHAEVYPEYGTLRKVSAFVIKGWFSMSKVERKELVTQMRIVKILFIGTNGPKFMTI